MEWEMAIAGALVVIGHMYPVFHRLRGGKGVAPALGVLFVLMPTWRCCDLDVDRRRGVFSDVVVGIHRVGPARAICRMDVFGFAHPFFVSVVVMALC